MSISFSIRRPTADGRMLATPTFEACALWLVPNASFTYRSASEANSFANSSPFFVSSFLYLVFSSRAICPSSSLLTSSFTFSSTTTGDGKNLNLSP